MNSQSYSFFKAVTRLNWYWKLSMHFWLEGRKLFYLIIISVSIIKYLCGSSRCGLGAHCPLYLHTYIRTYIYVYVHVCIYIYAQKKQSRIFTWSIKLWISVMSTCKLCALSLLIPNFLHLFSCLKSIVWQIHCDFFLAPWNHLLI